MVAADWQFQLGGLTFGAETPYRISELGHEKPEVRTQDTDLPGQDGIRMGRDYMGGTVLSISLGVEGDSPDQALDRVAELRKVWRGDPARNDPGAVQKLVYRRPGAPDRAVYGRPRRFTPATMVNAAVGWVPLELDFQAVDDLFYTDVTQSITLTLPETDDEAIVPPFTPPATPSPYVDVQGTVTNGGDAPAWPVVTFTGPVTNPSFWYPGRGLELAVLADIPQGQTVTVDTRPWARSVTGAGAGQARGARMVDMALPVGQVDVAFSGHDLTATAEMTFEWRDAWTSL